MSYLGQFNSSTYKTTTISTAIAGQTVFACSYDPLLIDVFQNGVKLINGVDFTADTGKSITLTVGATLGDSLELVSLKATVSGDVSPTQLQNGTFLSAQGTGTSDIITATFKPGVSGLTDGMSLYVRATNPNLTTTPTFSPNGLSAKTIVKGSNLPLIVNDIAGAGHWLDLQYDLTLDKWVLLNPANGIFSTSGGASIPNSPALTGTPTAPTAPTGTATTQIATTAFVDTTVSTAIASVVAIIPVSGGSGTSTSSPIVKIVRGYHTFGWYNAAGKVFTRGYNNYGQIGDGVTSSSALNEVQFPSAYNGILVTDMCSICSAMYVLFANGDLFGWGYNAYGNLGIGNTTNQNSPVLISSNVATMFYPDNRDDFNHDSAPESYIIIKKNDNSFWGAGYNGHGNLAIGTTVNATTWVNIPAPSGKVISKIWIGACTGGSTWCKTTDNMIYVVGYNIDGDLGLGNATQVTSWTNVSYFNAISDVIDIQNGGYYFDGTTAGTYRSTAVLTASGKVYTCGNNGYGQLGDGTIVAKSAFAQVTLTKTAVKLKHCATCVYVVFSDGTYARWGENSYGQLGDGTAVNKSSPVYSNTVVLDIFPVSRSGRYSHHTQTFISTTAGLYVCGYNSNGSGGLGNVNINTNTPNPVLVNINNLPVTNVLLTGASAVTSLVQIDASNILYSAGYNVEGELGYLPNTGEKYNFYKSTINL